MKVEAQSIGKYTVVLSEDGSIFIRDHEQGVVIHHVPNVSNGGTITICFENSSPIPTLRQLLDPSLRQEVVACWTKFYGIRFLALVKPDQE